MKVVQAYQVIGHSERRSDGEDKVTGKAIYTVDVTLPGMAHGKILRSPYAHARLRRIDASKAEKLPGVFAVITRADQARLGMFGAAYKDQTIVAVDKVRYSGDPVAAVAAVDEATAEAALALIDIDYEELPAVTDLDEALASSAPLVHECAASGGELMGQHYEAPKEFAGTNLCYRFSYAKGNVDEGFTKADHVFEDTFTFPRVQHFSMEPHATVADFEGDRHDALGRHARAVHFARASRRYFSSAAQQDSRHRAVSSAAVMAASSPSRPSRLPRRCPGKPNGRCAWLIPSKRASRPCTRHPARVTIKTGVMKDGKLVARQCLIHMETGAYADAGPRVTQKAGYRCFGPYRLPHMKTDAYTVYTNTVPAGAYRGFGTLQVTWAYESQMDIIAEKLGFDPLEFRLKNLLKKGELYTPGDTPVDCDLKAGLLQRRERNRLECTKEEG